MAVECVFHDQVSTKQCAGRGDRTWGRLHAKGTRFRSSYRARLGAILSTTLSTAQLQLGGSKHLSVPVNL